MLNIVYPYRHSNWQGNELKYSLRSLANFDESFIVWIIGDHPDFIRFNNNIRFIHHKNNSGKVLVNTNTARLRFLKEYSNNDDFIWMNDDIYFLNKCKVNDIQNFYMHCMKKSKRPKKARVWINHLFDTILFLREKGFGQLNYETHTPYVFQPRRCMDVFHIFKDGGLENRFLAATGYYNIFQPKNPKILTKEIKCGIYNKNAKLNITGNTLFLNHDDKGLTEEVKNFLYCNFPSKSIYEK